MSAPQSDDLTCPHCASVIASRDIWEIEVDAFVRQFAERAANWDEHPGDLEESEPPPWTDPDHPDEILDAAYRVGIAQAKELFGEPKDAATLPKDNRVSPLEAALRYAARGRPVFPCQWQGEGRKRPLVEHGLKAATTDTGIIIAWWTRWPAALIGVPTGEPIGCVVLDIDTKNGNDGFKTLADLDGCPILPPTPTVVTASGGAHLYFTRPEGGLRNTAGARGRGIGPGLDWRGDGGYVILPSPGSGYRWAQLHFGNCQPLPVPASLLPQERKADQTPRPVVQQPLSRYGEKALDKAVNRIVTAPAGQQRDTVNSEAYGIAQLVAGGVIPSPLALEALQWAARQIPSHDPRRPWRAPDLEKLVSAAFIDGLRAPRQPEGRR